MTDAANRDPSAHSPTPWLDEPPQPIEYQEPGSPPGLAGAPVLPDDAPVAWVDDDHAVVSVVVGEDVTVRERQGERWLRERVAARGRKPPPQGSVLIERLDGAWEGVVRAEVEASVDLVRVGGVAEAGGMDRRAQMPVAVEHVGPVIGDLGDDRATLAQREGSVRARQRPRRPTPPAWARAR